jgi:hypothetical protein
MVILEPVDLCGRCETPAGVRGWGDPAGAASTEEAPRHARGKRSTWSTNQQHNLTQLVFKIHKNPTCQNRFTLL